MLTYFRIFVLIFFPLVILFLALQFSVHPFLEGHSSLKLITNPTGLPSKVVFIIIDALRYNYKNRFGVIDKTMQQFPQSTFFAKSRVGSPTMTTQRVQSLMTGSEIFSIVNILRTFEAKKVQTDNIIFQLTNNSKISSAFGDNTWTNLFDFSRSAVCNNSFDIHDIDTCDQEVYRYLPKEMFNNAQNEKTADFIVAHLLGIDHIGHSTSSIVHPKMERKIHQISEFLENLFENSQNGTFFIVTGDHAMRGDGNHGGNSDDETQTFLFVYYKGGELAQQTHYQQFSQIQLTSTLSILLDIPLPLNTIGNPLIGILPKKLIKQETIREININLGKHYIQMLQFYTNQAFSNNFQNLLNANSLTYQKQILQELVEKLSFLKFSPPKTVDIITIAVSVSLLALFFLLYAFSEQLLRLLYYPSLKNFCEVILSAISLLTLLGSFFSSSLTKNLSDSLLIGIFLAVLTGFFFKKKGSFNGLNLLLAMGCIFIIAQTEPDKSNEYKTSVIRIVSLNQVCYNKYFQTLVGSLFLLLSLGSIRNEKTKKDNILKLLHYFRKGIMVLSYLNYIFVHIIKHPFHLFPILMTICLFIYLVFISFFNKQDSVSKIKTLTVLSLGFLGLFTNEHFPLVILMSWMINMLTYEYSTWCIIMGLWSKCVWWLALGNRYEYSGINILRTYVFSQSYSTLLNGICQVLYLNSPFILSLVLLNSKISLENQFIFQSQNENKYKIVNQGQEQLKEGKDQINSQITNQHVFDMILLKNNYKYVSVLIAGLVSALWTTIQNNQKLMFTIMCVPLLLLVTFITFSTLIFIWIMIQCFAPSKKIKNIRLIKPLT